MTREEALSCLNLPPTADREEIEKAYQRMVRRYPPEFHPERFRQIDEGYRTLTSLPFLLERLLAPRLTSSELDPQLFSFSCSLPESSLEDALQELRRELLVDFLWAVPQSVEKAKHPKTSRKPAPR
jgi:curved DNA-binding protein CbpA